MNDKSNETYRTPADWGTDSLGYFIEAARHNTIAAFANLRQQYDVLTDIDRLYGEMIENLDHSPELVPGFLLFRTHSSFRAAVCLCLSGQIVEAFMVLRGCLESALYGLYVAEDANRQEIWLRRHDDDASRRRVRNEFTIRNVLNHLQSIDANTHGIAQSLYERTIDYGAHPNPRAVHTQIKTESAGSRFIVTAQYFLCGDLPHRASLKSTAQIGICCLDIFYTVFRDRYRILGIDQRLDHIRQGL